MSQGSNEDVHNILHKPEPTLFIGSWNKITNKKEAIHNEGTLKLRDYIWNSKTAIKKIIQTKL